MPDKFPWTDGQVAILKRMWSNDTVTSEIGDALGCSRMAVIGKARRHGGARAGGFPGAEPILAQLDAGAPRRRVGLRPEGRAPVREGASLADAHGGAVGRVTSGTFGPSAGGPVAMGLVAAACAAPGTRLQARVRAGTRLVEVVRLPFVPHRYQRS